MTSKTSWARTRRSSDALGYPLWSGPAFSASAYQSALADRYNPNQMWLPVFVAIAQAAAGQPTAAVSTTLRLEPVVRQAKYCRDYNGAISLRLEFILHYRNESNSSIVLPMFARLSRYELFPDAAALAKDAAAADLRFRVDAVLDARKLDSAGPDPKLFWTLRPGESASSYSSLSILVQPAHKDDSPLPGRDHYLKLYMNPWPAERKTGEKLSSVWERYGILWLKDIPSLPFKFHVEHQASTPDPCPLRVD